MWILLCAVLTIRRTQKSFEMKVIDLNESTISSYTHCINLISGVVR
jgi:hypothetical protein